MNGPSYIKGIDLMSKVLVEPRWSVPGILPEGLALLVGAPKIGKSWAALNLALAVAGGGMALGSIPVAEGDVLYLCLEDNERSLRSRLEAILGEATCPPRVTFATEHPALDRQGLEWLTAWVEKHPEARMIIIDTLQKVRPGATRNGVYADDYAALSGLQQLAGKHGLTILVLHHTRKMGSDDPLQTVSGTQGLSGAADTMLVLKRERTSRDAELFITGRTVEEQKLALRWDPLTTSWTLLGEQLTDQRSQVVSLLREASETSQPALSVRQIADSLGKNDHATRVLLSRMAQSCQIAQYGRGLYTHISETRETLRRVK